MNISANCPCPFFFFPLYCVSSYFPLLFLSFSLPLILAWLIFSRRHLSKTTLFPLVLPAADL
ncbi:hypothetical protein K450DRAFT_248021 [Umbelopsis ramanniana AG]|uniref:Uncharacterized protein n=1 Tax=Umbelopsis ramanniana AG TaxID=1314678 RepID=A0AAD5HCU5_UMBRA|nr:uncharacterized protein K450DRAFT_248021 [Umbelopsis ramanniana AG]KAI8578264.1 hypothetical protein K450DRAFT_248021 [Umbelopsis ramanniana AG]